MYADMNGSLNIPGVDAEELILQIKDEMLTIRTSEVGLSLTMIQTKLVHMLLNMSQKEGELDGQEN